KVVNTLHYLEKRVNSMIEIWGTDGMPIAPGQEMGDTRPDAHLLNGPSLNGVSQDDVDALLANLNSTASPAAGPPPEPAPPSPPAATTRPAASAKPANSAGNGIANGAQKAGLAINQNEVDALFD